MRKSFPGYYRPTESEFKELWDKCIFVFDTNVLLNLYRYPQVARDDLINIMEKVSDRIWIPHQVALEFQENRLGRIAEQIKKYTEIETDLKKSMSDLEEQSRKLERRHSRIVMDDFLNKLRGPFTEFLSELDNLKKQQPKVADPDEIRDKIDEIYRGKVGPAPSQEELNEIYTEGENRYKKRIPPGFVDPKKKNLKEEKEEYFQRDLVFRRKYGDLILWKEMLKETKEKGLRNIIFITDDSTEDWWWKFDSEGEKIIGPHPNLIEEISSKGGVSYFYMYNTERFMHYAKKHLAAEVKDESIQQVRELAELMRDPDFPYAAGQIMAEEAVSDWLYKTFDPKDSVTIGTNSEFPIILRDIEPKIICHCQYFRKSTNVNRSIRRWINRTLERFKPLGFQFVLVCVLEEPSLFRAFSHSSEAYWELISSLVIGHLDCFEVLSVGPSCEFIPDHMFGPDDLSV